MNKILLLALGTFLSGAVYSSEVATEFSAPADSTSILKQDTSKETVELHIQDIKEAIRDFDYETYFWESLYDACQRLDWVVENIEYYAKNDAIQMPDLQKLHNELKDINGDMDNVKDIKNLKEKFKESRSDAEAEFSSWLDTIHQSVDKIKPNIGQHDLDEMFYQLDSAKKTALASDTYGFHWDVSQVLRALWNLGPTLNNDYPETKELNDIYNKLNEHAQNYTFNSDSLSFEDFQVSNEERELFDQLKNKIRNVLPKLEEEAANLS